MLCGVFTLLLASTRGGPFALWQFYLDPKPLLKLIFTKFLGSASGFVDVVAKHVPSPVANAQKKARHERNDFRDVLIFLSGYDWQNTLSLIVRHHMT